MDWQKLETLKKKILDEDDYQYAWDYFFTHLAKSQEFIDAGEFPSKEFKELIKPVILSHVQHLGGKPARFLNMQVSVIPAYHFYHGPTQTTEGMCLILYFSDIQIGTLALFQHEDSGEMICGLFTTLPREAFDKNIAVLPTHNETGH